jgi:Rhodopirellula transposase DDE domain
MGTDEGFLGQLGPELLKALPMLDERSRRLVLGMAAGAAGEGGTAAVAALTGASWQTVANGKAELAAGEELPPGRARRPGGGRKPLTESDPGLAGALEALIGEACRGDPESPLTWTTRSARRLAGELTAAGHRCSDSTVLRLMGRLGYTQQSNSRAQEGRQHPERDGQFRRIAAASEEFTRAGDPVISVDAKKREKVGNYGQDGREWGPAGEPVTVRSHDFPDKDGKHAIPYGVYDEKMNAGFVNVGTGGNTAALAVESVRRWHRMVGQDAYPQARRLLVVCDAGGSNGYANNAWKSGLADLAAETGLDITVMHFPPGTSKWNKIEHRLFCQISLAWRARPLTSYDVIINTIGAVTTKTGLTACAVLDQNPCPTGTTISDQRMKDIETRYLTRGEWHGEWNYTLHARPLHDPEPGPGPASPSRLAGTAELNQPALTGMQPADLTALAAALDVPFAAYHEQRNYKLRGGRRVSAVRNGGAPHGNRKIDVTGHVLATRLRDHLHLTARATGALLGVDPTTISHATSLTRRLLAENAIPLPPAAEPPATPIRTLDHLRDYAARNGMDALSHKLAADTSPQTTLRPRTHRKLGLF